MVLYENRILFCYDLMNLDLVRLRYTELELVDDATCADIYLAEAGFQVQPMMQCAGG